MGGRSKPAAWALGALALAATSWWGWSWSTRAPEAVETEARAVLARTSPGEGDASTLDALLLDRTEAGAQREAVDSALAGLESPSDFTVGETLLAISGQVVMEDPTGIYAPQDVRAFSAMITAGSTKLLLTIPVEDGRFRLEFLRGEDGVFALPNGSRKLDELALAAIGDAAVTLMTPRTDVADHWLGWVEPSAVPGELGDAVKTQAFPFGQQNVTVVLRQSGGVSLAITDSATGSHLTRVTVRARGGWSQGGFESPGTLFPPPAVLRASDVSLWASKRGYADQQFEIDPNANEQHSVTMDPGATLTVQLVGQLPSEGTLGLARMGEAETQTLVSIRGARRELLLSDLAAGDYALFVRTGGNGNSRIVRKGQGEPRLLGSAVLTLTVGESRTLRVMLDEDGPSRFARLRGEILVADGWGDQLELEIQAVNAFETEGAKTFSTKAHPSTRMAPAGYSRLVFSFDAMPLGNYVVSAPAVFCSTHAILPEPGNSQVFLETALAQDLVVTLVEEENADSGLGGQLTPHEKIVLTAADAAEGRHFVVSPRSILRDPGMRHFAIAVPQGKSWSVRVPGISGYCEVRHFVAASLEIETASPIKVEVPRTNMVTMVLMDGENKVPWPESGLPMVRPVNSHINGLVDGSVYFSSSDPVRGVTHVDGAALVEVAASGNVYIRAPKVEGYVLPGEVRTRLGRSALGRSKVRFYLVPE